MPRFHNDPPCKCPKGAHCDEPNCTECGACANSGRGWANADAGGPLVCDTCLKETTNANAH